MYLVSSKLLGQFIKLYTFETNSSLLFLNEQHLDPVKEYPYSKQWEMKQNC